MNMNGHQPIDLVRSRREIADLLGISVRTLTRMETRGEMPPRTRISDRRFGYRDSVIKQFLDARTAA
jgi:predicted DNA-binding transcriptional regulator AlpA